MSNAPATREQGIAKRVGKMAKVVTLEGKMATRLPSTGLKMAKMASHTGMM